MAPKRLRETLTAKRDYLELLQGKPLSELIPFSANSAAFVHTMHTYCKHISTQGILIK